MAIRPTPIWLADIREEIVGIRGLTANVSVDEFAANWAMKRAVEHALLIIAEAAKHIPHHMKATAPDVPWQRIHGLGNLLRHEYRRIEPVILWSVISDHLGPLERAIADMQRIDDGKI